MRNGPPETVDSGRCSCCSPRPERTLARAVLELGLFEASSLKDRGPKASSYAEQDLRAFMSGPELPFWCKLADLDATVYKTALKGIIKEALDDSKRP